ncbi:MAG: cyclic pyranopterin monophosphate synthase MoaC [Halobacteriota archaeon]
MAEFSHVEGDRARMVDVGDKEPVDRRAVAIGAIRLRPSTVEAIRAGSVEKGQVLATARVAGIQAAKRTAEAIPMCHPLPISSVDVRFELGDDAVEAEAAVATTARTGVEMEALSAVTGALLTVWDMVKSAEKDDHGQYPDTVIEGVRVVEKRKGD